jgi:Arc/MetJ family transcription regulator
MRPQDPEGLPEIVHAYRAVGFTGDDQDVLVAHAFEHGHLLEDFPRVEGLAFQLVVQAEAAIGADVLALVAQIQGRIQADGLAKTLQCTGLADARHAFQMRLRLRRNQCSKVLQVQGLFGRSPVQGTLHIRRRFGPDIPFHF